MSGSSWGRRLVWTQFMLLVVMGATVAGTGLLLAPPLFRLHAGQSGHEEPAVVHHAEQAFHDAGLLALAAGLAIAVIVALCSAWVLKHSLVRGLDALVAGAVKVSHGDYDHPVQMPSTGAEIAQVGEEFNKMASRIQHTEDTRRRMLTDLGHEMRTPLAAAQVTIEGLQDGVLDYGPEVLELLERQVTRLTVLADGISEVSRAEEGRIPLDLRQVDINDIVHASCAIFRPQFDAAGITLDLALGPGTVVDVDPERVGQLLDNVLRNALQHTRAGDTVRVTASRGDAVDVSITDTGTGIPPESLPLLFERFYHADDTRTRDMDGGSGIGLTISRAIARSHGGDLTATSDGPGHGARFTLRLPTPHEPRRGNHTTPRTDPPHFTES